MEMLSAASAMPNAAHEITTAATMCGFIVPRVPSSLP
jgi:hypothetical protein